MVYVDRETTAVTGFWTDSTSTWAATDYYGATWNPTPSEPQLMGGIFGSVTAVEDGYYTLRFETTAAPTDQPYTFAIWEEPYGVDDSDDLIEPTVYDTVIDLYAWRLLEAAAMHDWQSISKALDTAVKCRQRPQGRLQGLFS